MKNYLKTLSLILLIFICLNSNGQQNDTLEINRNEKGIVSYINFQPNSSRKMDKDTILLKLILKCKNEDSFKIISEIKTQNGYTHRRYQQYYKGLKVETAEFFVHGKNGIIESINGDFVKVKISSLFPTFNQEQAIDRALQYVRAKKYKWEDENLEKLIKERRNDPNASYYPKGELLISNDYKNAQKGLRLAWKFTISSLIPDNEQWILVDAVDGAIIGDMSLIYGTNTAATAQTLYNLNNVGIICDSYLGGFKLSEIRTTTPGNNVNIHTLNCLSGSNYANAVEFSNANTNWTIGSWPAIIQDRAALDAHWGHERVIDYLSTVTQRNSIDNQGLAINGYVHYNDQLRPMIWPNNAQWDGANNVMRYGDGDGVLFTPLVAIDIVAHEIGHGINQYTSFLHSYPQNQECDALNEGFSDIWGARVEHWAAPNKQTWLIGEDIFTTPGLCLRDMQNPHNTSAMEGQHPNTWHGTFWSDAGESHTNSTVLSHWFYLLSEGGTGWNNGLTSHANPNNGYSWSVNGIGINDASTVAYLTQQTASSSETYSTIRTRSITAASNEFNANSCQVIAVTNAWYAVGVGGQYQYSNVNISGSRLVCSSGSSFTVGTVPPGCTVSWTSSNNLELYSSAGNSAVFKALSSGSGWIQANINSTACGTSVPVPIYNVWVGEPSVEISGPTSGTVGNSYTYYENPATYSDPTSFEWTLNPPYDGNNIYNYGYWANAVFYNSNENMFQIGCTPQNTCGVGSMATRYISIYNYGYDYSVSPNPASNEVTVTIVKSKSNISESDVYDNLFEISIFNMYGILQSKQKYSGDKFNFPVNNLKDGNYIIKIDNGKFISIKQLVIKH